MEVILLDLKKTLKKIKLNESMISMFLGVFIVVLVGILVVNYIRTSNNGKISQTAEEDINLPATHVVEEGEDLWTIAEKYYDSGYNWVDIAEENDIDNPNMVSVGEEITIPDTSPIVLGDSSEENVYTETPSPTITLIETTSNTITPVETLFDNIEGNNDTQKVETQKDDIIIGDTYTVVRGDTLWDIAERAYGDGFKWKEIAEANDLVNPSLIHRGNEFTIPR